MVLLNFDYSIFIPPLVASIVGSILTISFIVINGVIESRKRKETILKSFKRELNDNKRIMGYNLKLLMNEIDLINNDPKKEGIIAPLTPLKTEMNALLNLNMPNKLISDDMISKLGDYFYMVDFLNELNNIRELFKNTKRGLRDIRPELKDRDQNLIENYAKLAILIEDLISSHKI